MRRPGLQDIGLVLCFVLLAVIALRPSGVLGSRLLAWNAQRQVKSAVRSEWRTAAEARQSVIGSADARGVIFEFSDYLCPFCRASRETVNGWADSGDARVVLVHLPLSDRSIEAARVAICAEEEGAFREVHDYLLIHEEWSSGEVDWKSVAEAAGIAASAKFVSCLDSTSTTERLARDVELAARWRINATPAFVSERGLTVGEASDTDLETLLAPARR